MRRRRRNPKDREEVSEAWREIIDNQTWDIWDEWLKARKKPESKRGMQKWKVVPRAKLLRVWRSYAELGFVRDENAVDDIGMQMVINVARLYVNTVLMSHTTLHPQGMLEDIDENITREEAERLLEGFDDFILAESTDALGRRYYQWRISDRIEEIGNLGFNIMMADTAADRISAIDMLLQYTHPRTDLSASYIEGGSKTRLEMQNA